MSLRLFSRAPCTRIISWLSAAWTPVGLPFFLLLAVLAVLIVSPWVGRGRLVGPRRGPDGSAAFLDADHVACGIADGAVTHAVRLLRRLLDDLGVTRLQPLEGA